MKEGGWTEIICRGFCPYFKEGKEDLHCAPYFLLRNNVTILEIQTVIEAKGGQGGPDFAFDEEIEGIACSGCDFRIDGCDFRQDRSGPPCGGYTVLEALLKYLR